MHGVGNDMRSDADTSCAQNLAQVMQCYMTHYELSDFGTDLGSLAFLLFRLVLTQGRYYVQRVIYNQRRLRRWTTWLSGQAGLAWLCAFEREICEYASCLPLDAKEISLMDAFAATMRLCYVPVRADNHLRLLQTEVGLSLHRSRYLLMFTRAFCFLTDLIPNANWSQDLVELGAHGTALTTIMFARTASDVNTSSQLQPLRAYLTQNHPELGTMVLYAMEFCCLYLLKLRMSPPLG